jgi:hypothetical protein
MSVSACSSNFKTFVQALEALPASIKADEVNIGSFLKPDHMYSDVGCFAGLISIVADDIPELKQAYDGKFYNSCEWKYALDKYLEFFLKSHMFIVNLIILFLLSCANIGTRKPRINGVVIGLCVVYVSVNLIHLSYALKAAYDYNSYSVSEWRHALNMFIQDDLEGLGFDDWAKYYPRVWGNVHGASMYCMYEAFGVEVFYEPGGFGTTPVPLKPLTHYGIIVHVRKAYDRWIKLMETFKTIVLSSKSSPSSKYSFSAASIFSYSVQSQHIAIASMSMSPSKSSKYRNKQTNKRHNLGV